MGRAYAKHYTVKVSENGIDWETILVEKNKTNKDAKLIELNEALSVKYLRFDFIEKGTHYGASIYELKFNGKFFTELYSDTVTSEVVPSTSSPIKAPQRVLPKKPKDIAPKSEKQQKPEVQKIKSTDKHIYI